MSSSYRLDSTETMTCWSQWKIRVFRGSSVIFRRKTNICLWLWYYKGQDQVMLLVIWRLRFPRRETMQVSSLRERESAGFYWALFHSAWVRVCRIPLYERERSRRIPLNETEPAVFPWLQITSTESPEIMSVWTIRNFPNLSLLFNTFNIVITCCIILRINYKCITFNGQLKTWDRVVYNTLNKL